MPKQQLRSRPYISQITFALSQKRKTWLVVILKLLMEDTLLVLSQGFVFHWLLTLFRLMTSLNHLLPLIHLHLIQKYKNQSDQRNAIWSIKKSIHTKWLNTFSTNRSCFPLLRLSSWKIHTLWVVLIWRMLRREMSPWSNKPIDSFLLWPLAYIMFKRCWK